MGYDKVSTWQLFAADGSRKYLTATEHARLLTYADRCSLPRRAFLYALAYSGCRISEVLALTIHHVVAEEACLIVRTLKRRRPHFRVVPVPWPVVRLLLALHASTGDPVFWRRHRTSVYRWVKRAMHQAGIEGTQASPKGLRHTFGASGARLGLPITTVQQLLGHASLTTTAIYYALTGEEERALVRQMWATSENCLPRARPAGPAGLYSAAWLDSGLPKPPLG